MGVIIDNLRDPLFRGISFFVQHVQDVSTRKSLEQHTLRAGSSSRFGQWMNSGAHSDVVP